MRPPSTRSRNRHAAATGRPRSASGVDAVPSATAPWSTRRLLDESDRLVRHLQQLERKPWWRVSGRELDELDARVCVLRAHALDAARR